MTLKVSPSSTPEIACILWDEQQVAAAIGMRAERVQRLARSGALPGFKVGRNWRFDPEAIRFWIKGNGRSMEVSSTSE